MTDEFQPLTGPVNNLGSDALKVGKLQENFKYLDSSKEGDFTSTLAA